MSKKTKYIYPFIEFPNDCLFLQKLILHEDNLDVPLKDVQKFWRAVSKDRGTEWLTIFGHENTIDILNWWDDWKYSAAVDIEIEWD